MSPAQRSSRAVVAALALGFLATSPLIGGAPPAPPPVTFNLTGVGSGANLAGVYTSPYSGNINGGATIPVICDDFADESFVPETWTAYQTSMSSLISGMSGTPDTYLKWLNTPGSTITVDSQTLNQAQAYAVAAVLAVDIVTATTGSQAQKDYSYALWGLFDPTDSFNQLSGLPDQANAENDLKSAVTFWASSANATQVAADVAATTIYSYDPVALPTGCGGTCPPPPQEFLWVNMDEPRSPVLLGIDFLGLAGLVLFARRRGWLAR